MSIEKIIKSTKTIVIIGCSSKAHRTSYRIAKYLVNAGFTIIPVNPNEEIVLGETCYPRIADIPDEVEVDVIDIFRNKRFTAQMVEEIVEWAEKTAQKPIIWTQIGVSSSEAKKLALENDFTYVEDRCIMVEHGNLG